MVYCFHRMLFVVQIILNVVIVISILCCVVSFIIGFIDDKDFYLPAGLWLVLAIGAIAASYLLGTGIA